jgi:hypothetical protein
MTMLHSFNRQPREVKHLIGLMLESPVDFGRLACVNKHTSQLLSNWPLELRARQTFTVKKRKTNWEGKYIEWMLNGKTHREKDQPAAIWYDGTKYWHQNGKLHREGDQPAVIQSNGIKQWCQHGKPHRDGDQPAIIHPSGTQEWCQHGKTHRDDDLPAIIYASGRKSWYVHGKLIKLKR